MFLSYASEDSPAARRICDSLRAAGIEVWFDQSELRGGDAWDRSIREQIRRCRLFVPVISARTDARPEGYFRREWKLAVDRTHDMSERVPFLVPVVIDDTGQAQADVPDRFRDVQWTRLPGGEVSEAFVERLRRLLNPAEAISEAGTRAAAGPVTRASSSGRSVASRPMRRWPLWVAAAAAGLGYLVVVNRHTASGPPAFVPPPHSVAVLPFVNMSGDKAQDYFSDGLSEELLNDLARINELQVAARTSSFAFRSQSLNTATIARELNVGAILEGSVRRSGHTVRVSAELINAVTGFNLWSQTYDRDFGDVLTLQSEIANAVAGALKVTLLGDVNGKVELGGTRDPAAFDAYLRGWNLRRTAKDESGYRAAVDAFSAAIDRDPGFALAYARRSLAYVEVEKFASTAPERHLAFEHVETDARKAIALAPDLAEGHAALATFLEYTLDFRGANTELERAVALAPGDADVLRPYSRLASAMGHADAAIAAARKSALLDPLSASSHRFLGLALYRARRYEQAVAALTDGLAVDPDDALTYALRGFAYYELHDYAAARASCESKPDVEVSQICLAMVYDKLGRRAEADAMLERLTAKRGEGLAYQYAEIHSQRGDTSKAIGWLETALKLQDPGLSLLKTDPLLDPLRAEARFREIERSLNFPD